jgi:hypothetical protein
MKTVEHLTKEQLAAYAANRSAPIEIDAIENHLLQCAACRNLMPAPTPEQFWSALLLDEPEREENFAPEVVSPARSPFSAVFSFFRQPAVLGACALILIAAFSLLIWRGAAKQSNPEREVAQTIDSPKTESNLPTAEKSPPISDDKIQTIESPGNSQLQTPLLRPAKPESNLKDTTANSSKSGETEDRELTLLLENTPPAVSSLRPNGDLVLRNGTSGNKPNSNRSAPTFSLLAPVGETVLEPAPEFRWQKLPNATSYRISILDGDFNEVATAEVSENRYKLDKPLKRGAKYLWRVAAQTANGEVVAPLPPQPPAVFRVAAANAESKIERLKKNESDPMKLAVFYANEGMLDSAACTLKEILAKNPKNNAARRLLAQVERWKKENNATVQRCGPAPTVTKADQ